MNTKLLLGFYFNAERLNDRIDKIILRKACASGADFAGGAGAAEEICVLIGEKRELCLLWDYLNGVMGGFGAAELSVLRRYADKRERGSADAAYLKKLKSAAAKFRRRVKRADGYSKGIAIISKYRSLMCAPS